MKIVKLGMAQYSSDYLITEYLFLDEPRSIKTLHKLFKSVSHRHQALNTSWLRPNETVNMHCLDPLRSTMDDWRCRTHVVLSCWLTHYQIMPSHT